MSTRTTYGDQSLPTNANVVTGYSEDGAAILSALQTLAARNNKVVCLSGTGASSGAVTTPTIRLSTNGTSVNALGINVGGSSWMFFSASSVV